MTQSVFNTKGVLRALTKATVLLLGASFILSAQAQSSTLECALRSSYTALEHRGLYITGGVKAGTHLQVRQAFMIDLSKSWNTNNSSINNFADGPFHYANPNGISSDGKNLYTLVGDQGFLYNATSKSWPKKFRLTIQGVGGLIGAMDPTQDMMYIPFGYPNANRKRGMLRVNLKNGDTESGYRSFSLSEQANCSTAWNPL